MSDPKQASPYEQRFAEATGAGHAVAYGYARQALRGIVRGIGLVPGDRVVLSPLTCRVVVLALLAERAVPIFADVERDTLNLSPGALRAALAACPSAVLFQHTYGGSEGLAEVAEISEAAGVALIEDRAQCAPRVHALRGVAAIYSNNLRKPLPAGSGGVATTSDSTLAAALRAHATRMPRAGWLADARRATEAQLQRVLLPRFFWPLYALAKRTSSTYRSAPLDEEVALEIEATELRPSAAQERAGERWLERAPQIAAQRAVRAEALAAATATIGGLEVPRRAASGPLYFFPLLARDKRALLGAAEQAGLEVVAWPVWAPVFPLETVEGLAQYGYEAGSCPVAERLARELVGLPTDSDTQRERLLRLLGRHATAESGDPRAGEKGASHRRVELVAPYARPSFVETK